MVERERKQNGGSGMVNAQGAAAPGASSVTLLLVFALGLVCAIAWQNIAVLQNFGRQGVWIKVDRVPTEIRLGSIANADDVKRAAAVQALVPITHTLFVDGLRVRPNEELTLDRLRNASVLELLPQDEVSEATPLHHLVNVKEFEPVARAKLTQSAYSYISSGAEDEVTMRLNMEAFRALLLRPRVLVDVHKVDTATKILGHDVSMPVMIAPAALGKLLHPDGEKITVTAAKQTNVLQALSSFSSLSLEEVAAIRGPEQPMWFQLYVNPNRTKTAEMIKRADKAGYKALCITVDAAVIGRRERDLRVKAEASEVQTGTVKGASRPTGKGIAWALGTSVDATFAWEDLAWVRELTNMPIVIKGIQTREDAELAIKYNVAGVVVSNHGGRQLDAGRAGIDILPEVVTVVRAHGSKTEVFVDGGVRRGTDIVKALALGARAVLVGRPILYAGAAYGTDGVVRALDMLKEELVYAMALCGVTRVDDITESFVYRPGHEVQFGS